MIFRAEQIFDKVYLDRDNPSEFMKYLSYGVERELINKVMDKLNDHKLYIVKLHEPEFIEDLPGTWADQCAYRQNLEYREVVQCKDCKMTYPWCQKFRDGLDGNGFCPYGNPYGEIEGVENE